MQDLISVIVPVYKVEKSLNRCIQSIVNQIYTNLEIILVDDGSPDECPQLCDEWAQKDSRIVVIHKDNGGVSSARNIGLDIASGEFIGFVDSDDYIEETMYFDLVKSLKELHSQLSSCNYYRSDEIIKVNNLIQPFLIEKELVLKGIENEKIYNPYNIWCKLFLAKSIGDLRFDTSITIGEDLIFVLEFIKNIKSISHLNKPLYCYNITNDSAVNKFRKTNITFATAHLKILDMDFQFEKNIKEYLKYKAVLSAASYIIASCYQKINNNEDDMNYAKYVVKQYYSEIRSYKNITLKKKIMIFFSLHFTGFYICIKRILKRGIK
ncbi:MAG: glycosyltransferase [Eubacteriales bacterium]